MFNGVLSFKMKGVLEIRTHTYSFRVWVPSPSMFLKCMRMNHQRDPLYCKIIFHCVDVSPFIYPFTYGWTFWLFLVLWQLFV